MVNRQIFTISNGGVLKLTVGKFITRDGQDIAGIGIIPDSLMDAPDIRTMQISNRNIKYYVK